MKALSPTAHARPGAVWLLALLMLAGGWLCWPGAGAAQDRTDNGRLTQADLDGYIYLLPRLVGQAEEGPEQGSSLLREAGLSRRRAAYVGAKVAIAQALVSGILSSSQLTDDKVPLHLQPSAEELTLVNDNLASLVKAQQAARRAAARAPESVPSPRTGSGLDD